MIGPPLSPSPHHSVVSSRFYKMRFGGPRNSPCACQFRGQAKLAKVARALLENVADDRTLDQWAQEAGMARRTFMRAFSSEMSMPFGRWRQQARLFAALEMLAQEKSITDVAIAVGYNSVSAFIEVFRAALGTTPQAYFGRRKRRSPQQGVETPKGHWEWREDIIPPE